VHVNRFLIWIAVSQFFSSGTLHCADEITDRAAQVTTKSLHCGSSTHFAVCYILCTVTVSNPVSQSNSRCRRRTVIRSRHKNPVQIKEMEGI